MVLRHTPKKARLWKQFLRREGEEENSFPLLVCKHSKRKGEPTTLAGAQNYRQVFPRKRAVVCADREHPLFFLPSDHSTFGLCGLGIRGPSPPRTAISGLKLDLAEF
jgi:hypothetical protein